jgi:ferredoxin--NADP+ reductase
MAGNTRPLRIAVVGAGPAGFYCTDALLKQSTIEAEVDLFDRLPTPFGLVRSGVAPDHQKIKRAVAAFEKTAGNARFRYFGNVDVGKTVSHQALLTHYDQVAYATGSSVDRRLRVPGEDLAGSHPATVFVGWYNGHPDACDETFDLGVDTALVVGIGNVAIDVARILIRNPEELAPTDIPEYALARLRESPIREVVVMGRRGPAQAAFDQKELMDCAELEGVQVRIDPEQTAAAMAHAASLPEIDRRKVEYMHKLAQEPHKEGVKIFRVEFLASPVELIGEGGRVTHVRCERNALVNDPARGQVARGTGQFFDVPTGLVMRSIGYQGVEVPGVPFDGKSGIIPNKTGRVLDADGQVLARTYVVGWIKRGPSGVIGTNKPDAVETAQLMIQDAAGVELGPDPNKTRDAVDAVLANCGTRVTTYDDWRKLDAIERERGAKLGKVRLKFHRVADMLAALEM